MKKILFFLTAVALTLLAQGAFAQRGGVEVTGTVTDASTGEVIPFASIRVDGTITGASTSVDGTYSIKVPSAETATLVFSFVGYKTLIVDVANRGVVDVALEPDALALQETIVVAFGTATRESFTGSATVVDSETLSKRVTTNVSNALVGTTPGLQIKGSSGAPGAGNGSINIRGLASMYADTDPLIIVDGAPYSASLSNIPQGDVESITVLKDAASAALYGSRGAAGVILITTKSGQNKKAQVNVDMRWGANSRSVQDYRTITDPGQYYEAAYVNYFNYYFLGKGQDLATANVSANDLMLNQLVYNVYTVPEGQQLIGTNGKLNPNATLGRSYEANGETYYLYPDNWRDAAYKNAFRQEYEVSLSGAADKTSYYASFGYLDEDGVIEYSGYKRFSARVKADYQPFKWLKVGTNVGYVNSNQQSNPNLSNSGTGSTNLSFYTTHIAPIYPIYVRVLDENGNPQIRTDENGNPQYDYGVAASNYPGLTRPFLATGNPLGSNRYNKVTSKGQQLNATFNVDVNFTRWLKFTSTNNINWGHTNYSDYESGLYGPKVSVNGQIDKYQNDALRQNYVQTLMYYDQFGQHGLNVMVGHEWYDEKTTYLYAYAQGLYSSHITEIDAAANPVSSSSYITEYNVEGWFASAQYNYAEKLFFSASYRRDASSRFAKSHRWGDFWSFGAAWLMNKEPWFKSGAVDELKLKASVGQQGNDNIGNWAYTDLYSLTASSSTDMSATYYQMGNEDISWETTTNFNVGTEFSFWNNRLSGEFEYYYKKTADLLFWLSVPESAGTRGYYGNMGDISNAGVELSLTGT
ncbi:MAG: SusC/RagA family TonB-linked outer membrane protein, partial [Clostridia bacterium]|nr:SusC/RagA family TonB-linked outer membrane protein [Clostridia bacterium]